MIYFTGLLGGLEISLVKLLAQSLHSTAYRHFYAFQTGLLRWPIITLNSTCQISSVFISSQTDFFPDFSLPDTFFTFFPSSLLSKFGFCCSFFSALPIR